MDRAMSIAEARDKLTSLAAQFEESSEPEAIMVTRYGDPVLAIMPWAVYETLVETLDVLSDPELALALRRSISEALRGETIPWTTVKEKLGL